MPLVDEAATRASIAKVKAAALALLEIIVGELPPVQDCENHTAGQRGAKRFDQIESERVPPIVGLMEATEAAVQSD